MAGLHLALIATAVLVWGGQVAAANPPDYKVGDTVVNDIVAPGPLSVVDVEATKALWKKEAEEIPFIFQYSTNGAAEAEKEFRAAVAKVRSDFLKAYNASSERPAKPEYFPLPSFASFVTSYRESTGIPLLTTPFAEKWVKGESDELNLTSLLVQLRKSMMGFIRPDALPEELSIDDKACVVTDAGRNARTVERIEQLNGTNVPVNRILSLTQAKLALEQQFDTDHALGRYLASFLRPNCSPDAGLTWSLRSVDGEPMLVADNYKAGDVIARRGEIVTSKSEAALQLAVAPPTQKTPPKAPRKTASRSVPLTPVAETSVAPVARTPAAKTPAAPAAKTPAAKTRAVTTPPAVATPVAATPAAATPAVTTSAATTPAATAPVATAPVATAPVATAPVATAPVATAPVATAPVATAPVATAPVATTPVATTPVATTPVTPPPTATPVATTLAATTPPGTAPTQFAITIVFPPGKWTYVALSLIALLAAIPLIRWMLHPSPAASFIAVSPADASLMAPSERPTESGRRANNFAVWRNRAQVLFGFIKRVFTLAKAEWESTRPIGSQAPPIPSVSQAAINPHEALAHYGLGIMYANGLGVEQNWVEGYARLILSAGAGENKLAKACRELETKMSPEQITQGRDRAQQIKEQMLSANVAQMDGDSGPGVRSEVTEGPNG